MSLPKSIKSSFLKNQENSYANSVLQIFIHLDYVKNWLNNLKTTGEINNIYYNSSLTKDIYLLYNNISAGLNPDSSELIKVFRIKSQNTWYKNITLDPYHFLYYFLELIHIENNKPKNSKFDFNVYRQQIKTDINNDEKIFELFNNYLNQTQNSFVSNNFYNINKFVVTCPQCTPMFNYAQTKIIRFNLDDMLKIRKELEPLKVTKLSLTDCFKCSKRLKKIFCNSCRNNSAFELKQIYDSPNVLIIEFNRKNNNSNFLNDVKFYLDFDISELIINKECENKKYKLKGVVCRYGINKYFSDVYIQPYYYRFMDCLEGKDVKIIKDANEILKYEPQLLIYEVENKNKMNNQNMMQPSANPIFQQMSDLSSTMMINLNLMDNIPQIFQMNDYVIYFTLKFIVRPQIWDQKEESALIIKIQVTSDLTVKDAIDRFFTKLPKPKESIISFTFKDIQLDINSQQRLKDLDINEKSVIYALKGSNYDELTLVSS